MESLSTIVLFLIALYIIQGTVNYTVGFISAIQERIHKRIIKKQKRWANRIIKNL